MQQPPHQQLDWLKESWKWSNDYFKHKENLCHAIILVEIALVASLVVSPIPGWYENWLQQRQLDCFSALFFILPQLFLGTVVAFLFLAHSLLLMQLRMRRVADALGDGIGWALTNWTVNPPTAEDLAPVTQEGLEKCFNGMHETNWFNKFVFPTATEKSVSNTDAVWALLPRLIVDRTANLLRNSRGRQFEKTIASTSFILLISGVTIWTLRLLAWVTR